MWFLALVLGGSVAISVIYGPAPIRWVSPDSRLGFLEQRISGVGDEFLRRSPRLRAQSALFGECMRKPACNPTDIVARKNEILKEEWPGVFDRLLIAKDWGEARDSAWAHRQFREEVAKRGPGALRDRCVPDIEFRQAALGNTLEPVARFLGFRCS